jgi:3-oxoacyl-[acyl-carrier-protein] synthase-3
MVEVDRPVFVTGCGAFLPGEPVSGDQAERLLGCVDGRPSRLRRRVLAANGIATRHYALDTQGNTTMLNEELAARAVTAALAERGITLADVGMLAAGTTQGDVLVPGFASMVHGRLGGGPLETLSAGGVCCSGMAAFKAAAASVRLGEHPVAVAVGSELVSRSLKASRYAGPEPGFDAEFLRWMLSDGAGAVVLESEPRPAGTSLRVDWVHLASYAHEHPTCMYAGTRDTRSPGAGATWLDQPTIAAAEAAGLLRLRQDTRALPGLVELGVAELARLTLRGLLDPARVDHLLCHYSSEHFRPEIHRLLEAAGLAIPSERWFTNLPTRGNTGAASIFVMLEECWRTGRFRPGDRVLLMVPESGRFTVAFAHLTCVPGDAPAEPSRPGRRSRPRRRSPPRRSASRPPTTARSPAGSCSSSPSCGPTSSSGCVRSSWCAGSSRGR